MIDITKLQQMATAIPPLIKALPERLEDLSKARNAIMKAASPATAAVVSKLAGKSTPLAVHAAVFGGGFVAGAVTTAFFTPMSGDELRRLVKSEAQSLWSKWRGQAEEGETASGDVDDSRKPLSDLSREELYDQAREADIPGRSEMNKEELIEALHGRLN